MSTDAKAQTDATPSRTPAAWLKISAALILTLSAVLMILPTVAGPWQSIDRHYPLASLLLSARALFISAGFATFHLAAYLFAVQRRYRRGAIFVVAGYLLLTLGYIAGQLAQRTLG